MSVDSFLSRFKIQTKVLVFILPFIVSISAVGLVGLYASGLLQGRMAISNSVMASLSGFRDVSASMTRFLANSTTANYNDVNTRLKEQQALLQSTLSGLQKGAEGTNDLQAAIGSTAKIEKGMANLWSMHEKETALGDAFKQDVGLMIKAQLKLADQRGQADRKMQQAEGGAKMKLYENGRVLSIKHDLETVFDGFANAPGLQPQLKYLSSQIKVLNKSVRKMHGSLRSDKKQLAKDAKKAFETIKALTEAKETNSSTFSDLSRAMIELRDIARQIGTFNDPATVESIQKLASLDGPNVRARGMQADSGKVMKSIDSIQIELASFLAVPTEENRNHLLNEFKIIHKDMEALSGSAKGEAFFDEVSKSLQPAIEKMEKNSAELVAVNRDREAAFKAAAKQVDGIWGHLTNFAEIQKTSANTESGRANTISLTATLVGIVIAIFAGIGLVLTFKKPIGEITSAMRRLADGVLDTSIKGETRVDEIGDMARALGIFKQNALEKVRMETASEEQRAEVEAERARNDAEKKASEEQIAFAVNALAAGLERLSQGDLAQNIETPFGGSLERLRSDFNGSLLKLRETLSQIQGNALTIQANGAAMHSSADDLSRRTENQAASLEQTAAAVDEITATVRGSADRAREANMIVDDARKSADESTIVVGNAIDAMNRIEDASKKIEQIIDVIEDIAFQTNLLALNAGIEAARAGDSGKGFAVVAMEVRELAQRSANAAGEIKGLIDTASNEISSGVTQVEKTGKVISEIGQKISEISQHVNVISTAAQDQSSALHEVNSTVNQMDQMTQANAAMVEETNAMSQQLASEADQLMQLIAQFRLEAQTSQQYAA